MSDGTTREPGFTRREFLRTASASAMAMGLGAGGLAGVSASTAGAARPASSPDSEASCSS